MLKINAQIHSLHHHLAQGIIFVILTGILCSSIVTHAKTPNEPPGINPQTYLREYNYTLFFFMHASFNQPGYLNILGNGTGIFLGDEAGKAAAVIVLDNTTSPAFHYYQILDENTPVYSNYTAMKEHTSAGIGSGLPNTYNTTILVTYPFAVSGSYSFPDDPNYFRVIIYFEGEQGSMDIAIVKETGDHGGTYEDTIDGNTQTTPIPLTFILIPLLLPVIRKRKSKEILN